MKKPRKTFQAIAGACLAFAVLRLVRGALCPATEIDDPHSAWIFLGALLTALGWVGAAWGFTTLRFYGVDRTGAKNESFAEGLAWVFTILFGFGFLRTHLGLIGPDWRWLDEVFWCAGFAALGWGGQDVWVLSRPRGVSGTAAALGILGFAVFLRLLGALVLSPHGDPLYYHLMTPLHSFRAGGFGATPSFPYDLQSGPLEYVFGLAMQILMGPNSRTGLVESHLAAQVLHVLLGYVGVCAVVFRMSREFFPRSDLRAAIAVFIAVSAPGLVAFSSLAKNDWTAAFLGLLAWMLIREAKPRRAFFFAGLAFSVKLTSALFLVPFLAYELLSADAEVKKKLGLRMLKQGIAFGVLAAAPVALRNLILSGNPFFPAMLSVFPSSWASPSLVETQSSYENLRGSLFTAQFWSTFVAWIRPALHFFPAFLAYFFFATYFTRAGLKKNDRELFFWSVISIAMLVLLFLKSQGLQLRLAGPLLIVISFVSGVGLVKLISQLNLGEKNDWVAGAIAVAITSPPVFLIVQWAKGKHSDVNAKLSEMVYAKAKRWIRDAEKLYPPTEVPGERYTIGMIGESGNYYLSPVNPRHLLDDPALCRVLDQSRNAQELCRGLYAQGIRNLFLNLPRDVIAASKRLARLLDPKLGKTVYSGEDVSVVHLSRCEN